MSYLSKHVAIVAMSITAVGVTIALFAKKRKYLPHEGVDANLSEVSLEELLNPSNRADHLQFNATLLAKYPTHDVVRVSGRLGKASVFLVHRYDRVMEVIANHQAFTSNPWPESRSLVTLNTMDKLDHDRVYKILKKYYTASSVEQLKPMLIQIIEEQGVRFLENGDVVEFSKRFHMHVSLVASGLSPSINAESVMIDKFIKWNDIAVRLTAPLGGVGRPPRVTAKSTLALFRGMIASIPSVGGLIYRIGFFQTWKLLSPLEALFPSEPYGQTWDYPELLKEIPIYFNCLFDLMMRSEADTPAGALFRNIGINLSGSEALATAVQLMVNMTTANAVMSLIFRRMTDSSTTCEDILDRDAPLQRNPRRALFDTLIGETFIPKGSLILLMLGSANADRSNEKVTTTFGFGLHHCLGRHLVNSELECVSEWLIANRISDRATLRGTLCRLTDIDVGNWGFSHFKVSISE